VSWARGEAGRRGAAAWQRRRAGVQRKQGGERRERARERAALEREREQRERATHRGGGGWLGWRALRVLGYWAPSEPI
jgi:hypothetical protein